MPDNKIAFCNDTFAALYELKQDDMIGFYLNRELTKTAQFRRFSLSSSLSFSLEHFVLV